MSKGLILPEGVAGRWLALGVSLLVALAVWSVVLAPLWSLYAERQAHLSDKYALLETMQRLQNTVPQLQARLKILQETRHARNIFLSGDRDALAAADLQHHLGDLAEAAHIMFATEEIVPAVTVGPFRAIGVRLCFSAHWPEFVGFVRAIEKQETLLLMDDLALEPAGEGGDTVSIRCVIAGYRAASGKKS